MRLPQLCISGYRSPGMWRSVAGLVFTYVSNVRITVSTKGWANSVSKVPVDPVVQEGRGRDIQNSKICYGFHISFRSSDRRHFSGSVLWDLRVTLIVITGGGGGWRPVRYPTGLRGSRKNPQRHIPQDLPLKIKYISQYFNCIVHFLEVISLIWLPSFYMHCTLECKSALHRTPPTIHTRLPTLLHFSNVVIYFGCTTETGRPKTTLRDFRLPQRCIRDLRSSGMLRSIE
jgi:hypothetical protein